MTDKMCPFRQVVIGGETVKCPSCLGQNCALWDDKRTACTFKVIGFVLGQQIVTEEQRRSFLGSKRPTTRVSLQPCKCMSQKEG